MNVTLHIIINELEKLGLKQIYNDAELVIYSYGECDIAFISIYKKKNYCTIFSELKISQYGEYYSNVSTNYNLLRYMENPISIDAILRLMKILITQYKELKVYFKKQQIEKDFL